MRTLVHVRNDHETFRRTKNKLYRVAPEKMMFEGNELNSHFVVGEDENWVFTSIYGPTDKPSVAFHKSMIINRGAV